MYLLFGFAVEHDTEGGNDIFPVNNGKPIGACPSQRAADAYSKAIISLWEAWTLYDADSRKIGEYATLNSQDTEGKPAHYLGESICDQMFGFISKDETHLSSLCSFGNGNFEKILLVAMDSSGYIGASNWSRVGSDRYDPETGWNRELTEDDFNETELFSKAMEQLEKQVVELFKPTRESFSIWW